MLQRFAVDELKVTPWKNGGGSTREIACWPEGAGLDAFDWRASIATIAASGPFSVFAGVERTIVLLQGDGVRLQAEGFDHRLDTPYQPFAFSGDAAVDCTLLGGASTDFNLMVRRSLLRAELRVLRESAELPPAAHGLLLALHGTWAVRQFDHTARCEARQGFWWADSPQALRLVPEAAGALLLAVRMDPDL